MGRYTLQYVLILLTGFGVALLGTWLGQVLGVRWQITATPGGRRQHAGVISRLGGMGLALGFWGALALAQSFRIPTTDPNEARRLWGLIGGSVLLFVAGLLDDRFELPAWVEYLVYFIAAVLAIATLIILEQFNNPLTGALINAPWILYVPLTVFWITGMIVTVNWLDGLDGLAAGVAAIMAAVLALHMVRMGQYSVAPQALALLGAALGFLVFNLHPARAHMGSNGSYVLGYILAALGLIAGARVAMVLMVMGIPILDVAWTIIDRMRHGLNPGQGDRRHLHYRLQDAGLSTRSIVGLYWGLCAIFGVLALALSTALYKLLALAFLGVFTVGILIYLSRER